MRVTLDYLQKLVPLLRPCGLFVTHTIGMAATEYLGAISTDAALESTLVNVRSGEIAVTLESSSSTNTEKCAKQRLAESIERSRR
jgi:hypothetical protein